MLLRETSFLQTTPRARLTTLLMCILPKPSLSHSQNEGESHDVDENKGPRKSSVGISHDVDENKGTYLRYPTIFMIKHELSDKIVAQGLQSGSRGAAGII